MSSEVLLSSIIPFAGSGLPRICNGICFEEDPEVDANYHRLLGWNVLCRCSTVAKVWVAVNWDKLGNDTSTQIQHWASNVDITNVHNLFHALGIPVSAAWGWGFWQDL